MNKAILFGTVKAVTDTDDTGPGSFHVILSAPSEDRDNEIVKTGAFEVDAPLPDHITFDADHLMSVAGTVGSGRPYYGDDGALHVDGTYTSLPQGQQVRTLVNEGHIKTVSVAYMQNKSTKNADGIRVIESAELLNGAFVAVPSNRDAVVLSSKAATKVGARNNSSDKERIQAIHDHSKALGASSDNADTAAADEEAGADKAYTKAVKARGSLKAVAGSYEQLRATLCDALTDAIPADPLRPYAEPWVYATFPDHIVYCVYGADYESQYFTVDYTISNGSVTFGTSTPVDIVENVVPDLDEAADAASEQTAATLDEAAAAKAAAAEQDEAAARLRAVQRRFAIRARG